MSNDQMNQKGSGSKLALLRQQKVSPKKEVDIANAIDGFAASIDSKALAETIKRNSASVNLIIDRSVSMNGTSSAISSEINGFAERQAVKAYTTFISLTLFDDEVHPQFGKLNTRDFNPISPWDCPRGTNIYDALISAITPINQTDANHRLHLVITDGRNGGSYHSQEEVKKLITSRINCGEHIFLLFNDDYPNSAQDYASSLGIAPSNAVNFNRYGDGIKIIFQTIEDLLDGLRTTGAVPEDWAKAIQAHAANPQAIKARETHYLTGK